MAEQHHTIDNPQDISKHDLFKNWLHRVEWEEKLRKTAAHKALDIPEDDMDIKVEKNYGVGGFGKMAAALALGLGLPAGVALWKAPDIIDALRTPTPEINVPDFKDTTTGVGLGDVRTLKFNGSPDER